MRRTTPTVVAHAANLSNLRPLEPVNSGNKIEETGRRSVEQAFEKEWSQKTTPTPKCRSGTAKRCWVLKNHHPGFLF